LEADHEREVLMERLEIAAVENPDEMNAIYDRLAEIDSDSAEARASVILSGLQFTKEMMETPTKYLSGGWRMRVALARGLFMRPDILLLDEPTNHLDLHALLWLQDYLMSHEKTVLVVSHDRQFLSTVTTDIIQFKDKQLFYHPGNFSSFLDRELEEMKNQQHLFERQESRRKNYEESLERWRKQAANSRDPEASYGLIRSREHRLEHLGAPKTADGKKWRISYQGYRRRIQPIRPDREIKFKFPKPESLGVRGPILQLREVSFGFDQNEEDLLENVTLDIQQTSRIAILGRNGVGKSTLMDLIGGKLQPRQGEIYRHHNLRIAYFSQHHVQQLDLSCSAVEYLMQTFPGLKEHDCRQHLGGFGIAGNLALQTMLTLSGGQKSRVVLALVTFKEPHILILDEPTNHLDFESIEALIESLKKFTGGLLFVSHDQHLIAELGHDLWVVSNQTAKKFDGSFDDYAFMCLDDFE